mgnify:CR=1 FL=1
MTNIYKSEEGKQKVEALYRQALQRWPVPNRQLLVPTCQGDTFVIASGEQNQTPIVLLHGSGTNSAIWMRDVALLAEQHRGTRSTSSASLVSVRRRDRHSSQMRMPRGSMTSAATWASPAPPSSACPSAAGLRSTTQSAALSGSQRCR